MAYDQFESFKQPDEMSIIDYTNEFEHLNNKIHQSDMVLPTGMLAYKVLNSANISSEKKQLIRATIVALTYDNMTKQLKAIYGSSGNSVNSNDNFEIKCEPVCYANKLLDYSHQGPKDGYRGNRGSSSCNRNSHFPYQFKQQSGSNSENYDKWGQKTNPLDKPGKVTCCLICKSIYHWANSCPNKVKSTLEDVNITLFTQEMHERYTEKFVGETFNWAVLDSGCTKNVCGESWLSNYLDTLTEVDKSQVSEEGKYD